MPRKIASAWISDARLELPETPVRHPRGCVRRDLRRCDRACARQLARDDRWRRCSPARRARSTSINPGLVALFANAVVFIAISAVQRATAGPHGNFGQVNMTSSRSSLFISNVRQPDGARVDVSIADGHIAAIGPDLPRRQPGVAAVEDGGGALLLPGLVEGHTHLDKTLLGHGLVPQRGRYRR